MTSNTPHNLTFIPAEMLETNLAVALGSMGQTFGHQKLQELAARVQGYPTRNHRNAETPAREKVTFLVHDLHNESNVDMTTLDVEYLLVTFTREDLQRIRRAEHAAALVGEWSSVACDACRLEGYKDENEEVDLDDLSASVKALTEGAAGDANFVRTEVVQVNVAPELGRRLWVSAAERYGYHFTTSRLLLSELEEAFRTGKLESNAEWLLLPETD